MPTGHVVIARRQLSVTVRSRVILRALGLYGRGELAMIRNVRNGIVASLNAYL